MSIFLALAEILFVGDGRLERNLPDLVQAGLNEMGGTASVSVDYIDGAPLQYNLKTKTDTLLDRDPPQVEAINELALGQTSAMILSEGTPLYKIMTWHDPATSLADYAAIAHASNPDTRIFYNERWQSLKSGTEPGTEDDPALDVPWRERIEYERDIWRAIALKASEDPLAGPVTVIPIAQAMGRLDDEIAAGNVPGIAKIEDVFATDMIPNGRGLYYVAMVQLAAITGKSPEGLPAKLLRTWPGRDWILTDEQASIFQRLAWEEVQEFQALPPLSVLAMAADPKLVSTAQVAEDEVAEIPPAPVPDVIDFPGVTNPSLFVGLSGIADWSPEMPFLDLMKTARPWIGHLPGQWGGWGEVELSNAGALDRDGWPTRVPDELTAIATVLLTDLPAEALGLRGRYVVRYDGVANLTISGKGAVVSAEPGQVLFDYVPGEGSVILTIDGIDQLDPIRNISVVREDRIEAYDQGEIFNPDFLARIRGVKGVRFMDWMQTNGSTQSRFESRPKPSDYSWARKGAPLEVMIALCDKLDVDAWFNMPHMATDDYVRQFAQMAHDGMPADQRVWMEFSNEVWNWIFPQAEWANIQGKKRWGEKFPWVQYYALRATEVAAIWTEVYGADVGSRLTRVIATQTGYLGLEDQILNAPLVMSEGRPAPARAFDAYAITGYFSGSLGSEDKVDTVKGWIADSLAAATAEAAEQGLTGDAEAEYVAQHRFDLANRIAADELQDGSVIGGSEGSVEWNVNVSFPYHAKVAARNGLQLVMYEGGSHVVGLGSATGDETLTAFFGEFNYSEEMGAMYNDLLKGWAGVSDAPFNHFVDIATPSKWGSWGALRHLGDSNPRWHSLAVGCGAC
jgi:hypothetical protein